MGKQFGNSKHALQQFNGRWYARQPVGERRFGKSRQCTYIYYHAFDAALLHRNIVGKKTRGLIVSSTFVPTEAVNEDIRTFLHVPALQLRTSIRAHEDDVGLARLEAVERLHQRGHEAHAVWPKKRHTVASRSGFHGVRGTRYRSGGSKIGCWPL